MAIFSDRTVKFVMDLLGRRKRLPEGRELFSFFCLSLPDDTFRLVHFEGEEGLNRLYRFEFTLVSENPNVDIDSVLMSEALCLFLKDEDELNVPIFGIIAEFEQMHRVQDHVFYRAVLVPKLWFLTQTYHNQVFINQTVPQILTQVLEDGGLTSLDYEFRLQGEYDTPREYVCQYQETHFNFFCRWLQREGMYFYFAPSDKGEKVIITDTALAHEPQQDNQIVYSPESGLDYARRPEVLSSFNLRQAPVPSSITLNDYNYRHPTRPLISQTQVSAHGAGQVYLYGEHYRTSEEGEALARIRAEELLCRQKVWHGQSCITKLIAGYTFTLQGHYREDFNIEYLTTTIKHEGNQVMMLTAGLSQELSAREQEPYYRNSFTAIPKSVQFRPPRDCEIPRFHGTINARIDAAGSGQYAEMDEQGRYKVVLPFDLADRKADKASAWLRMAQPYVGSGHGMNFPLHKGAEVLLSFVEGNPDRPIITGAVPNPDNPGVINSRNQTRGGFQSGGGNMLMVEDKKGHERMVMRSGDKGSQISLGVGSPAEIAMHAGFGVNTFGFANTSFLGFLGQYFSLHKFCAMTGFKKLQAGILAGEKALEALPELVNIAGEWVSEGVGVPAEEKILLLEKLKAMEDKWLYEKDDPQSYAHKYNLADMLKQRQTDQIRQKAKTELSKIKPAIEQIEKQIQQAKDDKDKYELKDKLEELETIKSYLDIRANDLENDQSLENKTKELEEVAKEAKIIPSAVLGGLNSIVFPIYTLVYAALIKYFEAWRVDKKIKHIKDNFEPNIQREPAIILANMEGGNIFHMSTPWGKGKTTEPAPDALVGAEVHVDEITGKDIAIMTDQGQVQIYAQKGLVTLTEEPTQINAPKFELSVKAAQGAPEPAEVNLKVEEGDMNLSSETTGNIKISTDTGNIDLNTNTKGSVNLTANDDNIKIFTNTSGDITIGQLLNKNENGITEVVSNNRIHLFARKSLKNSKIDVKGEGKIWLTASDEVALYGKTVDINGCKITKAAAKILNKKIELG